MNDVRIYTFDAFLTTTGKDANEKIHNLCTSNSKNNDNSAHILHAVNLKNINTANMSVKNSKKNADLIRSYIATADHDISTAVQDLCTASIAAKQNVHIYFYLIDTSVTKSVYAVDGNFLSVRSANATFRADQLSSDRYFTDDQVSKSTEETRAQIHIVPVFQLPTPAGVTSTTADSFNIARMAEIIKTLAALLSTDDGILPTGNSLYALDAAELGDVSVAEEQAALVIFIASLCKRRQHITKLCELYRQLLLDCQHNDRTFCTRLTAHNPHYKYCRSIDMVCSRAEEAIWALSRHFASPDVYNAMSVAIKHIMYLMIDIDDDNDDD